MAAAPDGLVLKTSRDRQNWWQSAWIRRILLLVQLHLDRLQRVHILDTKEASGAVSFWYMTGAKGGLCGRPGEAAGHQSRTAKGDWGRAKPVLTANKAAIDGRRGD